MSLIVTYTAIIGGGVAGLAYSLGRQQLARKRLLRLLREERNDALKVSVPRLATAADAKLSAMLRWGNTLEQALLSRGFAVLGDLVSAEEPPTAISRYLVDDAGTMFAVLVAVKARPYVCTLGFESYTSDSHFMTFRSRELPQLAHRPSSHRQWVGDRLAIDDVIARHRAFAPRNDNDPPLCAGKDLNELLSLMKRSAELSRDWRIAQPADQLLDADLRGGLGKNYDRLNKKFARALAPDLPTARSLPRD